MFIDLQEPDYDHGIVRPVELWEISDGCIFMIREIALSDNADLMKDISKYLMQLPELGLLDQFQSASLLKENLFKSLPDIIKGVGKKPFRQVLELYLDPAFRTAKGKNCSPNSNDRSEIQLSISSSGIHYRTG